MFEEALWVELDVAGRDLGNFYLYSSKGIFTVPISQANVRNVRRGLGKMEKYYMMMVQWMCSVTLKVF